MNTDRSIILGTAMWGWSIDKGTCFDLLDRYYSNGFRELDTASNYPINSDRSCYRFAESAVKEWLTVNGINDLRIIVKVGSLSNNHSPDCNLTKSFLLMNHEYYNNLFGSNLKNIMIHWDNRESETEIRESLEALKLISERKCGIGISGIKHAQIYNKVISELQLEVTIELKHNILNSALLNYGSFLGKSRILVYGMNLGGVKLNGTVHSDTSSAVLRKIDTSSIERNKNKLLELISSTRIPELEVVSLNHLNMAHAYFTKNVSGIIIGPSNREQLNDSIDFFKQLKKNEPCGEFLKMHESSL